MSTPFDPSTVAYFIDHLFLPPRVDTSKPIEDVFSTTESELNLLSFVHDVVSQFRASKMHLVSLTATGSMEIDRIIKMLDLMKKLQSLPPGSDELKLLLLNTFAGMEEGGMYTV